MYSAPVFLKTNEKYIPQMRALTKHKRISQFQKIENLKIQIFLLAISRFLWWVLRYSEWGVSSPVKKVDREFHRNCQFVHTGTEDNLGA